ncbi:hypothetical protein CEP88_10960 [Roseobacter denitrificans]|uniref:Outer membrane protein beta-barrel domain-containing protein n=1 Tax=Roseobacter denitrificans (strain ATCC 33942 / OCh 114) TaxID=375451 RepID=Q16DU1_ROSDO|nr:outer membrane beta-barrel protein [Roseobacter denitrificans]ABG29852.1 conserved hypothetical protein [Roseobacter denitrificans OCh 114]AVL53069.1 hypothetical protein CEP88_10960 [Roseobacter denitrificans]SFG25823.1 hypothetical protein SAMN05443635_11139 [Roseobacter denitrificans OCh 114]
MYHIKTGTLAGLLALSAGPVVAQGGAWTYEGSFYLFAAETTLNVGGIEGELSFSDALDNLEFAGMGAFTASNGQWTFIADLMYFNLGFENSTPGDAFSRLDTSSKTTVFNALALYKMRDASSYSFHLGGGFRYFNTDTTLRLRPGTQPGTTVGDDNSWTDPIVAAMGRFELSDTWSTTISADYGNFVNDRETYQFTVTFDYEFAENWTARAGYRYLNVDNDDDDFRLEQSGPVLGVSYRF